MARTLTPAGCLLACLMSIALGCTVAPDVSRSAPIGSGNLVIKMDGFRSDAGQALVSLFPEDADFPDAVDGVLTLAVPVAKNQAMAIFEDIPWGEYAVSILHDEDGDGLMNRSWLGIPNEGHGASNNPQGRFAPPSFEEARFVFLAPERTLQIHLRYFQRLGGPGNPRN